MLERDFPMTNTHHNTNTNNIPELNLDMIGPDLEQLARATVDKTLVQARAASIDPVLGASSPLATYYMMLPRNDGSAQEQILETIARHVESLTIINKNLKFGIDPKYLKLIQSNDPQRLAELQTDYDPEPRGPTYRPDALIINHQNNQACLVDFKRQVKTIETTKLNRIADSLTIARAQVSDFLYKKHRRMNTDLTISWAILDCSDQDLPPRFQEAGVLGLKNLDAICGIGNIAAAYRLAREYMATEFIRGEAELVTEQQRFIPSIDVDEMIETAVKHAKQTYAQLRAPETKHSTTLRANDPEGSQITQNNEHQEANIHFFSPNGDTPVRRFGMFGT
jgi:hypothetical protein